MNNGLVLTDETDSAYSYRDGESSPNPCLNNARPHVHGELSLNEDGTPYLVSHVEGIHGTKDFRWLFWKIIELEMHFSFCIKVISLCIKSNYIFGKKEIRF